MACWDKRTMDQYILTKDRKLNLNIVTVDLLFHVNVKRETN